MSDHAARTRPVARWELPPRAAADCRRGFSLGGGHRGCWPAALAVAAFALWFALILIPVVMAAGLIAWLAFRYQIWRAGRGPGNRNVWRP